MFLLCGVVVFCCLRFLLRVLVVRSLCGRGALSCCVFLFWGHVVGSSCVFLFGFFLACSSCVVLLCVVVVGLAFS